MTSAVAVELMSQANVQSVMSVMMAMMAVVVAVMCVTRMVPTTMMSAVVMMTSGREKETRRNQYRQGNRGRDEAVLFHG